MFRRMNPPPDARHSIKPEWQHCAWLVFLVAFLALLSTGGIRADDKETVPDAALLEVVKVVYIPYRFRFMSYDIKPMKPNEITAQINLIDHGNRTRFVLVGADIPGTKFKVKSFKKIKLGGNDVSELTVTNKETGVEVVLPLKKIVDSPDAYAIFHYKGGQPDGKPIPDFPKRPGDTFTLPPGSGKTFKVLSIDGRQVIIELPDGTKKTLAVPK